MILNIMYLYQIQIKSVNVFLVNLPTSPQRWSGRGKGGGENIRGGRKEERFGRRGGREE
jgi:hypothetical protein